jgi:Trypsin-co-occurring domain 2
MTENSPSRFAETPEADELRLFIGSTLKAIHAGISESWEDEAWTAHSGESNFDMPDSVTFDIAVGVKRAGSAKGGFKVQVFSIGANGGGERTVEGSNVSRIQFTVPFNRKLYHQ